VATVDETFSLACQHHRAGNLAQAEHLYRSVIESDSSHADAYAYLAYACVAQKKLAEAENSFREVARLRPGDADAHSNLGNTLAEQGKLDEAAASYQRALALRPTFAAAHYNLANTLKKLGQLDAAAAGYRQALRLKPDYDLAHLNLGNLLLDQNELVEAEEHYGEALKLNPRRPETHFAMGHYLADRGGKTDEAIASFQEALRLRPTARLRIALATCQPVIYQSVAELESWRGRLINEVRELREQEVVHDVTDETAANLFYLPFQGFNDRDIRREVAGLHKCSSFEVRGSELGHPTSNIERRTIRVGFMSSFFRRHAIGFLMSGLVAQLSRKDFEVCVLSVGRHDDDVAGFFKQHADRFVELPLHLPAARRLIGDQQLDVLVYTDIGMDPVTSTLAHSRLAPVQCTTWGHPVTTGIDTIDYFISSKALETEEAEEHYTETLVRLKSFPIYCYRPEYVPPPFPPLNGVTARKKVREGFGLAGEAHVYACLQSLFKLHPDFDAVLGGLLRGDPQGTLVLRGGEAPRWEQLLRKRFAATLPDVVDRIRFLPRLNLPEFLNLMAISDVLLDPLHFGGGNTTYEALALGVPIVTLPSRFLRGRITSGLYKQMGILDSVVHSPGQYIEVALRLGTDKSYRDEVRDKILDSNNVLYENTTGVKELEEFLKANCR
jgi:protein O-GlcNAc transferase